MLLALDRVPRTFDIRKWKWDIFFTSLISISFLGSTQLSSILILIGFCQEWCSIFVPKDAVKTSNMSEGKISWIFGITFGSSPLCAYKKFASFQPSEAWKLCVAHFDPCLLVCSHSPLQKKIFGKKNRKKSLLKESCSTAGAKPFCYSSNKKKRYLKIRSKFTPHHPRILKIGIKQLDMVFEAKLKIG